MNIAEYKAKITEKIDANGTRGITGLDLNEVLQASATTMEGVEQRTVSGIKGNATQSNAPTVYTVETYPDGLFERYIVSAPITSPNSWGNIAVTAGEIAANTVFFNVTNGVVVKELSAKPVADPAKLPLYSVIKTANIVAGTQFIDDESGGAVYRVKDGQTLLPSNNPADDNGTKLLKIGGSDAGEYNVSILFPTGGLSGGNKYDLTTAMSKVKFGVAKVGLKLSYLDANNTLQSYILINTSTGGFPAWYLNPNNYVSVKPEIQTYDATYMHPTAGVNSDGVLTWPEAVTLVPTHFRKVGYILKFKSLAGYEIWRWENNASHGSVANWRKIEISKGDKGDKGDTGATGEKGDEPAHEWDIDGKLRFQNPDGSWGAYQQLNQVTNNYTVDAEQLVPTELLYNDETLAGDIMKRVDKSAGTDVNYKTVTTWRDGTTMTDAKVDGVIYIKTGATYRKRQYEGALNVLWFGAKGDGITDDTTAIKKCFDYAKDDDIILIPRTNSYFLISNACTLTSKKRIAVQVEGKVKLKDSTITTLSADMPIGQGYVDVASSAGFYAGQWVSISDDARPLQSGGSAHTKRLSNTFKITSIVGNRINLNLTSINAFSVAQNAKIGTTPSVILVEQCEDITIFGTGELDGNKAGQYHVEPVISLAGQGEDVRTGCCISLYQSPRTTVLFLNAKNALLHNVAVRLSPGSKVMQAKLDAPYDKNILGYTSPDCIYAFNRCTNSQFEDGITLYSDESNTLVMGNHIEGNGRYGLRVHNTGTKIRMIGNYYKDNWQNINVYTDDYFSENETSINGGAPNAVMFVKSWASEYGGNRGKIVNFNGICSPTKATNGILTISGSLITLTSGGVSGNVGTSEAGRGLTIAKVFGTVNKVRVSNFTIANCKVGLFIGPPLTKIRLDGIIYDGNTTNRSIDAAVAAEVVETNALE